MSAEFQQYPVGVSAVAKPASRKSSKKGKKGGGTPSNSPPPARSEPTLPAPPAAPAAEEAHGLPESDEVAPTMAPAAAPAPPAPAPAPPAPVPTQAAPSVALAEKYADAYASAQQQASKAMEPYVAKAVDGIVYIKVKLGDVIVTIKAKLVDNALGRRLEPYAVKVRDAAAPKLALAQAKLADAAALAKARSQVALEAYATTQQAVDAYVKTVVAKVSSRLSDASGMLLSIAEPVVVRAKGGYVYASGKVGEAVVQVRARRDSSQAAALEAYARAAAKLEGYVSPAVAGIASRCSSVRVNAVGMVEPYYVKVQDGVACVQGKVGEADVYIRAKVATVTTRASGLVESSVKPVYVKVKDGYMYVVARVGGTVVYIRTEITNTYDCTKVKALATCEKTLRVMDGCKAQVMDGYVSPVATKVAETYVSARTKALTLADATTTVVRTKATAVGASVKTVATDQKFQATAGAAASGAVALGASAGAAGFVTGGTIGAAVGIVPALFTFGLSIPIGAAIGAGTGLCVGTAAGSTMGLVGGGAVGYGVQAHKAEIGNGINGAMSKVTAAQDYVRDKAATGSTYIKAKMKGATGGTS